MSDFLESEKDVRKNSYVVIFILQDDQVLAANCYGRRPYVLLLEC